MGLLCGILAVSGSGNTWSGDLTAVGTFTLTVVTAGLGIATLRLAKEARRSADIMSADILIRQRKLQIDRLNTVDVAIIDSMEVLDQSSVSHRAVFVTVKTADQPVLLSGCKRDDIYSHFVLKREGNPSTHPEGDWTTSGTQLRSEKDLHQLRNFLQHASVQPASWETVAHIPFPLFYESSSKPEDHKPPKIEVSRDSWIGLYFEQEVPPDTSALQHELYSLAIALPEGGMTTYQVLWNDRGPAIMRTVWNGALALPEDDPVLQKPERKMAKRLRGNPKRKRRAAAA